MNLEADLLAMRCVICSRGDRSCPNWLCQLAKDNFCSKPLCVGGNDNNKRYDVAAHNINPTLGSCFSSSSSQQQHVKVVKCPPFTYYVYNLR